MKATVSRPSFAPVLEPLEAREGPSSMNMMSMMPVFSAAATSSPLQQTVQTFITDLRNILGLGQSGQLNSATLVRLVEADFLFMALTGRML
jgi:hypothetical protein